VIESSLLIMNEGASGDHDHLPSSPKSQLSPMSNQK